MVILSCLSQASQSDPEWQTQHQPFLQAENSPAFPDLLCRGGERPSMTSFFINFFNKDLRRFCRSPAMKTAMGCSVWYNSRYGFKNLACVIKNCNFAGNRGSFTDCCTVWKLWIFGILLRGNLSVSLIYFCTLGQINMARLGWCLFGMKFYFWHFSWSHPPKSFLLE